MAISLSSRRQFRAELDLPNEEKEVVVVTYRPATAQERTTFRCAIAADKGNKAITNPQDKDALRELLAGDITAILTAQAIACTLDISDKDSAPVLFDGKEWRQLTDNEKADQAAAFPGLFALVFGQANPQAEARLLGK